MAGVFEKARARMQASHPLPSRKKQPHRKPDALWAEVGPPRIEAARCRDVPSVLQLVRQSAADRDLNPQYLELPYMLGLAKDLFLTVLFKHWHGDLAHKVPAQLYVIRHGDELLGFSLLRDHAEQAVGVTHRELYLLCVSKATRRQGLAAAPVDHALAGLHRPQQLVVNTLSRCQPMTRLLRRWRATALNATRGSGRMRQCGCGRLGQTHRQRDGPLVRPLYGQHHRMVVVKGFVALHVDLREVNEHILLDAIDLDETIAFDGTEPLHPSCRLHG